MPLSKSSFLLGNVAGSIGVGLVVVACGGGGGSSIGIGAFLPLASPEANTGSSTSGPSSSSGSIKASNIILGGSAQVAATPGLGIIKVQANQLPENVKVQASNVTLVNGASDLQSADLQSALDKEIAINIPQALVGTWDVQNSRPNGCGHITGKISINADGTMTPISGSFSAVSMFVPTGEPGCKFGYQQHRFQLYGDGAAVVVTHSGYTDPMFPLSPDTTNTALVLKPTLNKITVTNNDMVSVLTRSAGTTPTSLKAQPAGPGATKQLVAFAR